MLEICLGTMATYKEDNNHILAKWDREDFREKNQVFRVNHFQKEAEVILWVMKEEGTLKGKAAHAKIRDLMH